MFGYQTIPTELSEEVATIFVALSALWTGWKNNYLGKKGRKQKEVLKSHNLD